MSDIILHQYAFSPFSEKVRLALGIKGLAWNAVEIAFAPPRPLLVPLTGGYRRTPVMQIGADIFCDTNIILPTLERLHGAPTLYPGGDAALAQALTFNWERTIWIAMVGVLVHYIGDSLPPEVLKDRKDDYLYVDISKPAMEPQLPFNVQRIQAQLGWVKAALADGRKYLAGDGPGVLDLGYFHALWLVRNNAPPSDVDDLLEMHALAPWYDRVAAIGHGRPTPMTAEDALAAARAADPMPVTHMKRQASINGLGPGAAVTVTPDDNARIPVSGTLVAADDAAIVLRRSGPQTGELHLHFPRAGFEVQAA